MKERDRGNSWKCSKREKNLVLLKTAEEPDFREDAEGIPETLMLVHQAPKGARQGLPPFCKGMQGRARCKVSHLKTCLKIKHRGLYPTLVRNTSFSLLVSL